MQNQVFKNCKNCNKEYSPKYDNQQFCCLICSREYTKNNKNKYFCKNCKKELNADRQFCNSKCYKESLKENKICEFCKKEFVSYNKYKIYCSEKCRLANKYTPQNYYDKNKIYNRVCKKCGDNFETNIHSKQKCEKCCVPVFISKSKAIITNKKCPECGNEFETKIYNKKFCSYICSDIFNERANKNRYEKVCIMCNKIYKTHNKKSKYCSKHCISIHSRSCVKMAKRSKNEIKFAELCESKFNNVLTNKQMFNGWDSDIILPDLKIAIAWNGIWHYDTRLTHRTVEELQLREDIKKEAVLSNNYAYLVIKDLGGKNYDFVQQKFDEFIQNFDKLIEKRYLEI